jgi:chromatin remodeling complex protein RSC6
MSTTITTEQNDQSNIVFQSFSTINDSITLFKMQLNSLQQHIRTLEKQVRKEMKSVTKVLKIKEKPKKPKAPSGFAKPTKVTKELCEFMEKPEGTEIARTEVTKSLSQYIKTNNLQEKNGSSKNRMNPDAKLKSLLGLSNDEIENLTYFTIQKHMNKHFIKKQPVLTNEEPTV